LKAQQNFLAVEGSLQLTEKEIIKSFTDHELIGVIATENPTQAEGIFRALILKCTTIAAIKNDKVMDELTISLLWNYVLKHYNNYTFAEIEKAVTYNESGLLDERVEHFHSFSLNYLSRVMGNWLVLKTKTRQRIAALLPPVIEKQPTDEDLYQGLLNFINLNNLFPDMWAWSRVYNHMDKSKMITESNDEKRAIFEKSKAKISAQVENELLSVKGFIERQAISDTAEDRAKVESRKQLIVKHLSHLLK
jgi:hypothetical protein